MSRPGHTLHTEAGHRSTWTKLCLQRTQIFGFLKQDKYSTIHIKFTIYFILQTSFKETIDFKTWLLCMNAEFRMRGWGGQSDVRSEKSSSDFQTLTQRRGDSLLLCGELWSFDDAFLDSWEIEIKELFNWNLIFFSLISLTKVWIFIVKNVKLNNVLLYSSWIKRCMTLTQSTNMWENFWKLSIVYYFCCLLSLYCQIWALGRIHKWYLCYLFGGSLSSCLCPINPGPLETGDTNKHTNLS